MTGELTGRRIVVPEGRELGQLIRMLEEHGAEAIPCPMIAIRDAPDAEPVAAWLRRFADGRCDDLVLMTGEGLRRLLGFARRVDLETKLLKAYARAETGSGAARDVWTLLFPRMNPRLRVLSQQCVGWTSVGATSACSSILAIRIRN